MFDARCVIARSSSPSARLAGQQSFPRAEKFSAGMLSVAARGVNVARKHALEYRFFRVLLEASTLTY